MSAWPLVLSAEARRLVRQPALFASLGLLILALGLAAWAGGLAAREHRAAVHEQHQAWLQALDARKAQLSRSSPGQKPEAAAAATFDVGRSLAPRLAVEGEPGLALAVHSMRRIETNLSIGIESRHLDARRTESLANPLWRALGRIDFALAVALLAPLALIALCHGLVHEEREAGRWRLLLIQAGQGRRVLTSALFLRALSVYLVAAAASLMALALDPASSTDVALAWLLSLAGLVATWAAAAALAQALPLSSSGATLALIAVWALTSFVVPGLIGSAVVDRAPTPSRLAAVVQSREIQQAAETRNDELLARWYEDHRSTHAASADRRHAWPVSFVPRYLRIDERLRPLMASFDDARAAQARSSSALAWLSPALSLVMTAEALAGADAERHVAYLRRVDQREDAWRGMLVPEVMAYRSLQALDIERLAPLGRSVDGLPRTESNAWHTWFPALLLGTLAWLVRRRFDHA